MIFERLVLDAGPGPRHDPAAMADETLNPYSAPATPEPFLEPARHEFQLASLGRRFLGALIDSVIVMATVFLVYLVILRTNLFTDEQEWTFREEAISTLIGFAAFVIFNLKFLHESGQSIGKKIVGTYIVSMDGKKPGLGDLLLKRQAFFDFTYIIPHAGPWITLVNVLAIFGRERRCLHDRVAGTRVVVRTPVHGG